jgi:hypothetical protein
MESTCILSLPPNCTQEILEAKKTDLRDIHEWTTWLRHQIRDELPGHKKSRAEYLRQINRRLQDINSVFAESTVEVPDFIAMDPFPEYLTRMERLRRIIEQLEWLMVYTADLEIRARYQELFEETRICRRSVEKLMVTYLASL